MAKKVLVVGGLGFVGTNIVNRLVDLEYDVTSVDDLSFGYLKNHASKSNLNVTCFSLLPVDFINSFDTIIFSYCSNIIYAIDNPVKTFNNNSLKAIECFSKFKGKIIYLSTSSVYGNAENIPTKEDEPVSLRNAYDTSKYIAETFLKYRGDYTTLRLSNVYGEYQRPENPYCGVINRFIHNHLTKKETIIYDGGTDTRDYTYVQDVVSAVIKCVELPSLNTEINIGTGEETSLLDLIELIGITKYSFFPGRKIDGITRRCLDISKAKELLDWSPLVGIKEGIEKTSLWIKDNY